MAKTPAKHKCHPILSSQGERGAATNTTDAVGQAKVNLSTRSICYLILFYESHASIGGSPMRSSLILAWDAALHGQRGEVWGAIVWGDWGPG